MYKELVHNRFILVHNRISTYKISTVNLRPSRALQCLREEPDCKSQLGEELELEQQSSTSQLRAENEQKRESLFSRKFHRQKTL